MGIHISVLRRVDISLIDSRSIKPFVLKNDLLKSHQQHQSDIYIVKILTHSQFFLLQPEQYGQIQTKTKEMVSNEFN